MISKRHVGKPYTFMLRIFFHITHEAKKKVLAVLKSVLTGGNNKGTMYEKCGK